MNIGNGIGEKRGRIGRGRERRKGEWEGRRRIGRREDWKGRKMGKEGRGRGYWEGNGREIRIRGEYSIRYNSIIYNI